MEKVQHTVFDEAAILFQSTVREDIAQNEVEMGWAMKQSQTSVRFSLNQKAFMSELWIRGERTNRKANPIDTEQQMRRECLKDGTHRFKRHEWLSSLQIARFWSNLNAKKVAIPICFYELSLY